MEYVILPKDDWRCGLKLTSQVLAVLTALKGYRSGNLFEGPWIAGGAARLWMNDELVLPGDDVDVFCSKDFQFNRLEKNGKWKAHKPGSLYRYDIPSGLGIELVRQMFDNIAHLFRTFPFTVCDYATDGYWMVTTEQAIQDNSDMVLRLPDPFVGKLNKEFAAKYIKKGYKPVDSALVKMIENAPERAEYSGDKPAEDF